MSLTNKNELASHLFWEEDLLLFAMLVKTEKYHSKTNDLILIHNDFFKYLIINYFEAC